MMIIFFLKVLRLMDVIWDEYVLLFKDVFCDVYDCYLKFVMFNMLIKFNGMECLRSIE